MCVFNETCGLGLALEHNGDLYSCDHFVGPDYLLGNVEHTPIYELVSGRRQYEFGQDKLTSLPQYCLGCDVRFACHGECPKNRFVTTPDGESGLNYLCAGFKTFFHHIDRPMKVMIELMRNNHAASEVSGTLEAMENPHTEALAIAGRNDPCPCDSGRKVKHCHGRPPAPTPTPRFPAPTGVPRPPVTERSRRAAQRHNDPDSDPREPPAEAS